jgi:hypothetical membrane protein
MSGDVPVAASHDAGRRGPLVPRAVRPGAYLLILGSVEFILAMAITQLGWTVPYSLLTNYISDLGAVHCGYFPSTSAHYVCSPWHLVFDVGIVLLGILLIFGVLLIQNAFRPGRMRTLGLLFLVLSAFGAIGVGLSPEDVNLTVHEISALVAFLFANLGMIVLGFAMFRDTRWDGFRAFSILSGLVGFAGLILYLSKTYGPLGLGGSERLIVAPVLLWAIVVGIHLARIPTYAPGRIEPHVAT